MVKKNIFAGTGMSKNDDPYNAAKEAVEIAIKNSKKKPEFMVVFASAGKFGEKKKMDAIA